MNELEARKSLSHKLVTAREQKHIAKSKLAKMLHVPVSTITSIENPRDTKLSSTNLHGLVRRYAKKVELPESNISKELSYLKPKVSAKAKKSPKKKNDKVFVASRATVLLISIIVLAIILAYATWQALQLAAAPKLDLFEPASDIVTSTPSVIVKGNSSPDASVLVNGDSVSLNENGDFEATIYMQPGQNVLTVQALNAFGNEASQSRLIYFEDQ